MGILLDWWLDILLKWLVIFALGVVAVGIGAVIGLGARDPEMKPPYNEDEDEG